MVSINLVKVEFNFIVMLFSSLIKHAAILRFLVIEIMYLTEKAVP
jgi:hypothetical protein